MSRLQEELREIESKLLKIKFFKEVKKNIGAMITDKKDEVKKEVQDELSAFIDTQIDMIESGEIRQQKEIDELFSSEEVRALKLVASKALGKNNVFSTEESPNPSKPQTKLTKEQRLAEMTANDPIKFALKHRHLENKTVKVQNENGLVSGKVIGLQAPNVVLELNNGSKIHVHVNKIME